MSKKIFSIVLIFCLFIIYSGCTKSPTRKEDSTKVGVDSPRNDEETKEDKETSAKIDPELEKTKTLLENDFVLASPESNQQKLRLLTKAFLESWNDFEMSEEMYDELVQKEIIDTLSSLLSWKSKTGEISPNFTNAINKLMSTIEDKNQMLLDFASHGLILTYNGERYDIYIPSSSNFEEDFSGVTTNLQKQEIFEKFENTTVLWKGYIVDVTENSISFKHPDSQSFTMDVMITDVKMSREQMLSLNSGDFVWYTGKLVLKEGVVAPWILSDGEILAFIEQK